MTDKVQKIREEIEKRLKGERFLSSDKEYNYLLSFIDSLQEEPVSESLEAFIKERVKNIPLVLRSGFHQLCRQLIRDGAEWKKEQMMEKAVETTFNVSLPSSLYDKLWIKGCKEGDKLLVIKKDEL